jgi:hypothetical protein
MGCEFMLFTWEKNNPIVITWVTMWQHCINISCREQKTELDLGGINQLIDSLINDYDTLRFITISRLCFKLINVHFVYYYYILRVGGGKI